MPLYSFLRNEQRGILYVVCANLGRNNNLFVQQFYGSVSTFFKRYKRFGALYTINTLYLVVQYLF